MVERVDVLVVGAGVMGAGVALELSRRGRAVRVIERAPRGSCPGASGGVSRAFRLAYTDELYAALARDCRCRWLELEQEAGELLLGRTGSLEFGPEIGSLARLLPKLGVACERLSARSAGERFGLDVPGDAIFVPEAGVLAAERVLEALIRLASGRGAVFEFGLPADEVREQSSGLVHVSCGRRIFSARTVVLAPGRWLPPLAAPIGWQPAVTFRSEHLVYLNERHADAPLVIDGRESGRYLVPGITPELGAKTAVDSIEVTAPDDAASPGMERTAQALGWIERLTGSPAVIDRWERCATIHTSRRDFIIDRRGSIVVLSACSGHGFKFAPRVAGVAADLAQATEPDLPGALLRRWSLAAHAA